jgi:hypothetical protein
MHCVLATAFALLFTFICFRIAGEAGATEMIITLSLTAGLWFAAWRSYRQYVADPET